MTNQEWLAKQIEKLQPEEVYDLMYNIVINIGSRYNTSRGGVADWLTQKKISKCVECRGGYCEDECGAKMDEVEEDLPSAERHGRWIYLGGLDAFECSVGGRQMVRNIFDYCPWCGSRMDLEGEEE